MEAKHTPGPWTAEHTPQSTNQEYAIRATTPKYPRGERIASVDFIGNNSTEFANARLIAAAPDLLEALREIAAGCINRRPGHVDAHNNRTKEHIESIARTALAKATGAA